jgi:hypothetical protein
MAKKTNPYLYSHEARGKTRYGYRREYKGKQLRARGFGTPSEAEQHLNQAIADVDAVLRGEVRCKNQRPHRKLSTSTGASSKSAPGIRHASITTTSIQTEKCSRSLLMSLAQRA